MLQAMDIFIAGDDVPMKKPDPVIYRIAAERLGVQPEQCLVIEDSTIGLQARLTFGTLCNCYACFKSILLVQRSLLFHVIRNGAHSTISL